MRKSSLSNRSAPGVKQPRRRGRPRHVASQTAEDPREQILRASAELFSAKGFAGTSMRDIAEQVGVRAPSLYYHFRDKDEIFEVLVAYGVEEPLAHADRLSLDTGPVAARLYLLMWELAYRLCSAPYDLTCFLDPHVHDPRFRVLHRKQVAWRSRVKKLVEDGVENGEFVPTEPALGLVALSGLLTATISRFHGQRRGTRSANDTAAYVARFAIRGLLRDSSELDGLIAEVAVGESD